MLFTVFASGVALGWILARIPGESTADTPPTKITLHQEAQSARPDFPAPSFPTEFWSLAGRVASLESLIEDLQQGRNDFRALGEQAVAAMSDAELSATLMSTVRLSEEELGDVRDLRAFAGRMLEVAMLGVTEPGESLPDAEPIRFSRTARGGESGKTLGARFPEGRGRIFATFRVRDPSRGRVLVKWFRADRPHILLMQRYSLKAGEESGYVWLEPDGGWESGTYQVDVYAADEAATAIATGRYEIW